MKSFARSLLLAVTSGVTAEFLNGDHWASGNSALSQQIGELVLYVLFYGSAAVLIREIARRAGRGFPTILLLALSFGVIEEGIVDQTLFNANWGGLHLSVGEIPGVGIALPWTIFVLTLHVVWSIGAPIVLAEAVFPNPLRGRWPRGSQAQAPWLKVPGTVVASALYVLGAATIFWVTLETSKFMASIPQIGASLLVAVILVIVAVRAPRAVPWRPFRLRWPALAIAFVIASAFLLVGTPTNTFPAFIKDLSEIVLIIGSVALVWRFRFDRTALAIGVIPAYFWLGIQRAIPVGEGATLEQIGLDLVVSVLLVVAFVRTTHGHRRAALVDQRGDSSALLGTPPRNR